MQMAIQCLRKLLQEHRLVDKAEPLLAGMEAALSMMVALKQKALDFARLQQGEPLTPQRAPVDLREVILTKLPSLVRFMPKSEALTVEYHVDDEIPQAVMSEGSWINMILVNFVSNAFKHTRQGSVKVSAVLVENHIRITVADTGAGVSTAMEKNLWQAFKQASRWQGGNGIGLYHMKELAVYLGGSVGYQANLEAGRGSLFWADLPLQLVAAAPPAEFKLQLEVSEAGGAVVLGDTVLLVEDDIFIQEMTMLLLKSLGVKNVKLASNGDEALQELQAPDAPAVALVLMDVNMPFMDGIECTRRIRAWESTVGTKMPLKILALSANGNDAACQRDCTMAGMDGILPKPLAAGMLQGHLPTSMVDQA